MVPSYDVLKVRACVGCPNAKAIVRWINSAAHSFSRSHIDSVIQILTWGIIYRRNLEKGQNVAFVGIIIGIYRTYFRSTPSPLWPCLKLLPGLFCSEGTGRRVAPGPAPQTNLSSLLKSQFCYNLPTGVKATMLLIQGLGECTSNWQLLQVQGVLGEDDNLAQVECAMAYVCSIQNICRNCQYSLIFM